MPRFQNLAPLITCKRRLASGLQASCYVPCFFWTQSLKNDNYNPVSEQGVDTSGHQNHAQCTDSHRQAHAYSMVDQCLSFSKARPTFVRLLAQSTLRDSQNRIEQNRIEQSGVWSRRMATLPESGSARGFFMLKGICSFPQSPQALCWFPQDIVFELALHE